MPIDVAGSLAPPPFGGRLCSLDYKYAERCCLLCKLAHARFIPALSPEKSVATRDIDRHDSGTSWVAFIEGRHQSDDVNSSTSRDPLREANLSRAVNPPYQLDNIITLLFSRSVTTGREIGGGKLEKRIVKIFICSPPSRSHALGGCYLDETRSRPTPVSTAQLVSQKGACVNGIDASSTRGWGLLLTWGG